MLTLTAFVTVIVTGSLSDCCLTLQAQRGSRMANAPQAAAATQAASRLHDQEARRLPELQGLPPLHNGALLIACSKAVFACLCDVVVASVAHSDMLRLHMLSALRTRSCVVCCTCWHLLLTFLQCFCCRHS